MVLFMIKNKICKKNVCLFISMVHFYDCKFSKMGIQGKCVFFISIVLFYDYKFLKMDISKILK